MQDRKGSPTATKYWEAIRVFQLANLQKKDVFCDLGCGYGFVCIWAARCCKLAVGIEEDPKRARRAKKNVDAKGLQNVQIIKASFEEVKLPPMKNLVLYSTIELELQQFETWKRKAKRNFRIVTVGPPPIPVKPLARKSPFYLTRFPYSNARTGIEWCNAVVRKRGANFQDVRRRLRGWLDSDALRDYERDFGRCFRRSSK
jgi:SAM-dependent methyltransferase